jgi:hypothetical protein
MNLQEVIEKILFSRALGHRLEGYTLETAQEIAQAITAAELPSESHQRGEFFDLQLMEDALFMAAAVDANVERGERMRELGERIYRLKRPEADGD